MKLDLPRNQAGYICCIITVLSLFLLLSCNGDQNASDDTGSLAVKFSYRGSVGNFHPLTSKLDCDQTGIDKIEAVVYDKNNKYITDGGPWECKDGKGTISSVKAGRERIVVIVGKDADGKIIFRGQRTGIKIFAGAVNESGDIECADFVPHLKTPEDGSFSKVGTIDLKWAGIDAAKGYEVLVFENEEMDQPLFTKETTEPECVISGLLSDQKTYYWQVVAFDDQKNESARSEKWSFVTGFSASTATASATATGYEHTLAIRGGELWSWGGNTYGQLGLGDSGDDTERPQPTQVGSDANWAHVAAGPYYSVAIKTDGTMWSWGKNSYQVLGQGTEASKVTSPTKIGRDDGWDYVAAGDDHAVAIKKDGGLWVWGANGYGQLGRGDKHPLTQPTLMDEDGWAYVTAGSNHTLGIKTNGQLWAWGHNGYRQLGVSGDEDRLQPVQVKSLPDCASVSTSATHTVAVTSSGELWAWGDNDEGQLGQDHTADLNNPVQVGKDKDWSQVAAANDYSLAVKKSGELWAWGTNHIGQLGLGDITRRTVPEKIEGEDWAAVSAKWYHAAAVTSDNKIRCWGRNTFGEVGNKKTDKRTLPEKIGENTDWKTIGRGRNYANFVIKSNGELWAWGRNQFGQLGLGDIGHQQTPKEVGKDASWTSVSNGSGFTAAMKEDGTLWRWGDGQMTPSKLNSDEGWIWVSCGAGFCVGIKETGADQKRTLWAWGSNNHGQLGLGDDERDKYRSDPVRVGADTSWRTVAAGGYHVVALKTDGTLWTWGKNIHGQLGLGSQGEENDRNSPTRVGTDNDWKAVAAGTYFSLAIKDDGTLWTWGCNSFGKLGHGDSNDRLDPTRVQTEESVQWLQAAAGHDYAVAITADGTLWSWGNNKYGQLGYKSSGAVSNKPFQIGADTDWDSVGASYFHVLALKKDGTLYGWGDNTYGQLGNGKAWQLSPFNVSFEP